MKCKFSDRLMFCEFKECEARILVYKSIFGFIQNGHPLDAGLELNSGIVLGKHGCGLERPNMQPRASTGDGFRLSVSSTPSNSTGGSDPDEVESQSDVYIWGQVLADGVSPEGTGIHVPSKTDVLIPRPIESNVVLNVCNIASGEHHLAILNKKGDVFTWGEESGGRLGHGIDKHFGQPRLVEFLVDATVDFIACGEFHTCAVSKYDDLFTWGDGSHNAGLLGHGAEASHWIPNRVSGALDGLQVVSVACGTWHSALATSNGKLFTFGDGAFGVLGHGDQESVLYPREVQLLSGLKTIKVACGVWHTAAIVEVVFQSGSNVSPWKLFTWGDGDKYCLGHANKEMYLQPTRVTPLIEYNFHQIACGHTMTVALTTSGHVFTMGSTENGQLGNPNAAGKVPTLVQDKLLGEFVEEISSGSHHVAVLTSKSELYTWGKGGNGRLGHGDTDDRNSPTLVVTLKDRPIKKISCGSNFTSCICIHKWVTGTDQSACCSCRQAFGLTRKRHNCYNCGLIFCHTCSSKKAMKAAMAPTPDKPHRVCDTCYTKLNLVKTGDPSKNYGKATTHCSTYNTEKVDQGVIRSTRILLSSITEPIKYVEIKNSKPGIEYSSTSFVRASQVPSLLQLKDIVFPSSLSSFQSVLKPATPQSSSQNPYADSNPTLPYPSRSSPLCSANSRLSGGLINSLRRKNDILNQEISNLQSQIRSLEQRTELKDVEIQKLQRRATEAIACAAVESSSYGEAKAFIESSTLQLKEMAERLPSEIPESKILGTMHNQAEDLVKEIFESETFSIQSKLESKKQNADTVRVDSCLDGGNLLVEIGESKLMSSQQNAFDISTSTSSTFEQTHRQVENASTVGVDYCQDGREKNYPKINRSMLVSEQQSLRDIPTKKHLRLDLQEHRKVKNVVADVGVDHCEDDGNFLQETNRSKFESKQQNSPASDIGTSTRQENILGVDHYQHDGNSLEEPNRSNFESEQQNSLASDTGTSKLQERIQEKIDDSVGVDQFQAGGHFLRESDRPLKNVVTAVGVDHCQDDGNSLEEPNRSNFESKQQNSPTSNTGTSKLQEHVQEKIDDSVGVDQCQAGGHVLRESDTPLKNVVASVGVVHCQDVGTYLEEHNRSKFESEQQSSPASDTGTFKLQEHILEKVDDSVGVDQCQAGGHVLRESDRPVKNVEAAVGVDHCQDDGNSLKETTRSKFESMQQNSPASDAGTSKLQEHVLEKIDDAVGVDQSQAGGHVLQQNNGSSISSAGEAVPPQSSENGSRSLESSRPDRQQETQVIEKFESGVYVILMLRQDGIKIFKRVKFSKRRFTESQAEEWWSQNKVRVLRKYINHLKI